MEIRQCMFVMVPHKFVGVVEEDRTPRMVSLLDGLEDFIGLGRESPPLALPEDGLPQLLGAVDASHPARSLSDSASAPVVDS